MSENSTYEELEKRNRELEKRVCELELAKSESKRMLEALQQEESLYQNIFKHMLHEVHVWELIFDDHGNIKTWKLTDANPAALKSWNKTLPEIIGKTTDEIFPDSNATALFMPIVEKIYKEGTPHRWESYFPDTQQVLHMISLSFGNYFISTGFDITESKRTEEERRKSDERFRIAQEMSPDGFTILRPVRDDRDQVIDFTWIYENEAVARMNGTDPQKVVGQRLLELFPGHQGTQFFNAYKQVAETGKSITFEERYVGETIKKKTWFRIVVVPMAENIAILNHDITERKIAEENLINTFNLSPSIIAKANLKTGFYVEANQAVTRILGYSIEEFSSKPIKYFIHPDDKETTIKAMSKQLEGKEVLIENRFLCKDGSYKWISWNANSANDEGIVLGVGSDVTERKKLQEKLNQAQKMEAIGTLAGGIAHDFNNILSAIIGYTELALDEVEKGTDLSDDLQEVYRAGQRAKELVKQILTISRHDEKEVRPIQVAPLIKEALKMLRSTIPSSIEFRETICSDPLVVNADSTQLHQIIINLATNAKQAMTDGSGLLAIEVDTISFESDITDIQPGDYVRITVSDSGCGIPADNLEKIFEPYFTTKEIGEGTGLGLSVVHGIVESHHGHITVYSEPEKGTSFHVYLPLIKKTPTDLPDRPVEPLPSGKERILLVDDEPSIVNMQAKHLKKLGYSVTPMISSTEALETFRQTPAQYDLIITDMTMPKMTGDRLAEEIKLIRPDMKVIFCTGFSEKINAHEKNIHIDEFLMKPVDKVKMATTVRKVLDSVL